MRRTLVTLLLALAAVPAWAQVMITPTMTRVFPAGTLAAPAVALATNPANGIYWPSTTWVAIGIDGAGIVGIQSGTVGLSPTVELGWSASATPGAAANDTFFMREGSAGLIQMGRDVNGATVAYTLKGNDRLTSDGTGGNVTLAAGRGKGTGAGGSLYLQTAPASDGALTTGIELTPTGVASFGPTSSPTTAGSMQVYRTLITCTLPATGCAVSGITTTTTETIPAGALILAVDSRTTTALTTTGSPTSWTLGYNGKLDAWGTGLGFSTGTVGVAQYGASGVTSPMYFYGALPLKLTLVGGTTPTWSTGTIKITIYYLVFTPVAS